MLPGGENLKSNPQKEDSLGQQKGVLWWVTMISENNLKALISNYRGLSQQRE